MMKQNNINLTNDRPISGKSHNNLIPNEEDYMKEVNPFRRIKINKLPDTKRTINPELAVN